jgi:Holliday junction resolvase
MPNKNYVKGRKKEYKICEGLKDKGWNIAQRTAGSHSPIDIFAINKKTKTILFIQSKPDNYPEREANKIKRDLEYLQGIWKVEFKLI